MKASIIALVLVDLPLVLGAQGAIRPVLDSTATCSYHDHIYKFSENAAKSKQVLEVFYIVENMPITSISKSEIEDILKKGILMNEQEMTYLENLHIQCVVNCNGMAGDFQIISCPPEMVNIGCQVLDIFKDRLKKWEPGRQSGKNVDVLVRISVKLSNGKFSVVAPVI